MNMLSLLEKQIHSTLIMDSERAISLRLFSRLALEWQLPDAQLRQGLNYFGIGEMDGVLFPVPSGAAIPVVMTDASTPLNALNLNKYVNAESKTNVKIRYAAIQWSVGTTFILWPGLDSAGILNGDILWNSPAVNWLNLTTSGYTASQVTLATPFLTGSYMPVISPQGVSSVIVGWLDSAGTHQNVPDNRFNCVLMILAI